MLRGERSCAAPRVCGAASCHGAGNFGGKGELGNKGNPKAAEAACTLSCRPCTRPSSGHSAALIPKSKPRLMGDWMLC